ncbi:c-type cytochrome [Rheinheimera sp.]|uniref:c-type cytochrome n=1 Tax=Rheinheimera sp. TaxID=1869214 RepID=UPI0023549DE9|nr:c-type cytochrome [Rheinheimera sp.]
MKHHLTLLMILLVGNVQFAVAASRAEAGKAKAACAACHGIDGNSKVPTMYPSLAGQNSDDLQTKLQAYREGKGSGPMAATMVAMAKPLSDQDIAELAAYFSQQKKR